MLLVKESVYTCLLFCLFVLFLQAFEDYEFQHIIPHDSRTKYIISVINIILAALFTTEMVLRWIGFGITRYFTNAWTLIDFVVVLVSSLFGSVTLIDFVVVLVSSLFGSVTTDTSVNVILLERRALNQFQYNNIHWSDIHWSEFAASSLCMTKALWAGLAG